MQKNKKTFFLIRHGQIDTQGRRCIGITDLPLTEEGKQKARRLGLWMTRYVRRTGADFHICSSPLSRCVETAENMLALTPLEKPEIERIDQLHEINMGEWENMLFSEIKEKFPEQYEERGKKFWEYKVPGGESFQEAGARFVKALRKLARRKNKSDKEEIYFIICHSGVIRSTLEYLGEDDDDEMMRLKIPYGSVTEIRTSVEKSNVSFEIRYQASDHTAVPDDDRITELLDHNHVPEHIRRHMKAVADLLLKIADELDPKALVYDRDLLYASAMLHDFDRLEKRHSEIGALKLRSEGYELLAEIISKHDACEIQKEFSPCFNGKSYLSEEDLLYYADKRIREDALVSLEERFEASKEKFKTS